MVTVHPESVIMTSINNMLINPMLLFFITKWFYQVLYTMLHRYFISIVVKQVYYFIVVIILIFIFYITI